MPRQEIPEGIVRKQRQPFHKQEEHDAGKGEKRYKGHARQQPPDRFFLQFSGHGVSVSLAFLNLTFLTCVLVKSFEYKIDSSIELLRP